MIVGHPADGLRARGRRRPGAAAAARSVGHRRGARRRVARDLPGSTRRASSPTRCAPLPNAHRGGERCFADERAIAQFTARVDGRLPIAPGQRRRARAGHATASTSSIRATGDVSTSDGRLGREPVGGSASRRLAMPLYDLPLEELRTYRTCAVGAADDLDAFWAGALATPRARRASSPSSSRYGRRRTARSRSTTSRSAAPTGTRSAPGISARRPPATPAPLPGRRSSATAAAATYPSAHALYPACGYATFVMDTRAQGGNVVGGAHRRPRRRARRARSIRA